MKYPRTNPEARQDLKDAMCEQAINNIYEDADRIEKIIEENADLIQDVLFKEGGYSNSAKTEDEFKTICFRVGGAILGLVLNKIELLAEEDVEEAME